MRKLWIFGDSLSVGFNSFIPNCLYDKSLWWSHILANKLECDEVINTAGSGNDRVQILYKWLANWNDIGKDDIVIYQIGFKDRYNLIPLNIPLLSLPADYIPNNFDMTYNGEYGVDLFNKVVLGWGKDLNIHFWNVAENWDEYSNLPNQLVSPTNTKSIWQEWLNNDDTLWIWNEDGRHDKHFNESAHQILAETFYKQING